MASARRRGRALALTRRSPWTGFHSERYKLCPLGRPSGSPWQTPRYSCRDGRQKNRLLLCNLLAPSRENSQRGEIIGLESLVVSGFFFVMNFYDFLHCRKHVQHTSHGGYFEDLKLKTRLSCFTFFWFPTSFHVFTHCLNTVRG